MSLGDQLAWMLRCHTGWPRIDALKRRSVEALHLPPGWVKEAEPEAHEQPSADLILVSRKGKRLAIVIESFDYVLLKRVGDEYALCWPPGRRMFPDPLERMIEVATRTRAFPVLWLPRARPGRFDVPTRPWPVKVVRGPADWLAQVCLND